MFRLVVRSAVTLGSAVLLPPLLAASAAFADQPVKEEAAEPPKVWTGAGSIGLSVTSGNSHTRNFNIAFDVVRHPKARHVMKWTGRYLQGEQEGALTVNRTSLGFRNEHTLQNGVFAFGQVEYLRDTFKLIDYLVAPTAGLGYTVIESTPTTFAVDLGAGAVWERNPEKGLSTSAAISAGEKLAHQLTATTGLKQSLSALWNAGNFRDGLYTFSIGVGTQINKHFELSIELLDTFKSRPPTAMTRRNDVSVVTAITAKYGGN